MSPFEPLPSFISFVVQRQECAKKTLGAAPHRQQFGLCYHWLSEPRRTAMRRSADVGEKVGSNGRLLPQPMSVPDP